MASNMSMEPQKAHKHRENCCFYVPIKPGVFVILLLFMMRSVMSIILNSLLIKSSVNFAIFVGIHAALLLGFCIGLVAMFKKHPKVFLAAPITALIYFLTEGGLVVLMIFFLIALNSGEINLGPAIDIEPIPTASIILGFIVFSMLLTIYFITVLFRLYSALRWEKKKQNLEFGYPPKY